MRAAFAALRVTAPLHLRLRALAKTDSPIVVGPWLSEVGYEILYWVPFLNWAFEEYGISPSRVTILSRGKSSSWYQHLTGASYRDIFSLLSPEEFRLLNQRRAKETGMLKQLTLSSVERELLVQANLESMEVLHPSAMFSLLRPFWTGRLPIGSALKYLRFRSLKGPSLPPGLELPRDYVAVKFYHSESFPETEANRALVSGWIERLATKRDVVLLGTGLKLDDHSESYSASGKRIFAIDRFLKPEHNLEVQTAVLAGARAFVGTYGGFSYLAPFFGVPSHAVYADHSFQPVHNDIMLRALLAIRPQPGSSAVDFTCSSARGFSGLSELI